MQTPGKQRKRQFTQPCVADTETRRRPDKLPVLKQVLTLPRGTVRKVFDTALATVPGFAELYALAPERSDAAFGFLGAFDRDVNYWANNGHPELLEKRGTGSSPKAILQALADTHDSVSGSAEDVTENSIESAYEEEDLDAPRAALIQLSSDEAFAADDYHRRCEELQTSLTELAKNYRLRVATFTETRTTLEARIENIEKAARKKRRQEAKVRLQELETMKKAIQDEEAKLKEILAAQ